MARAALASLLLPFALGGCFTLAVERRLDQSDDPAATQDGGPEPRDGAFALAPDANMSPEVSKLDGAALPPSPHDAATAPAMADSGMAQPAAGDGATGGIGNTSPKLCLGMRHACLLQLDGKVTCWGDDGKERSTELQSAHPELRFRDIACGWHHTCGITSAGKLVCVGRASDGQLLVPSDSGYVEVSASSKHGCARKESGEVSCWGAANSASGENKAPAGAFLRVAVGEGFSCGVRADHTVACWGGSEQGRTLSPLGKFEQLDLGGGMACASGSTSTCWGEGSEYGQTSASTLQIAVGESGRSCALVERGVYCRYGRDEQPEYLGAFSTMDVGPNALCLLRKDAARPECTAFDPAHPILRVPPAF